MSVLQSHHGERSSADGEHTDGLYILRIRISTRGEDRKSLPWRSIEKQGLKGKLLISFFRFLFKELEKYNTKEPLFARDEAKKVTTFHFGMPLWLSHVLRW
jgi:hypothetical protein